MLRKLLLSITTLVTTKTVEGPIGYFQYTFAFYLFASALKKISRSTAVQINNFIVKNLAGERVISNKIGTFAVNTKNDSFSKSLPTFELKHRHWLDLATHRDTFIDIGANIGFYSILASTKLGFSTVHAFEPNPETLERLHQNIKLNRLSNIVTIHEQALGDTVTRATLYQKPWHTGANSLIANKHTDTDTVTVQIVPFDSLEIDTHTISFIKLDVEGFELTTLRGMTNTLNTLRPDTLLFIEIQDTGTNKADIFDMLRRHGLICIKTGAGGNYLFKK